MFEIVAEMGLSAGGGGLLEYGTMHVRWLHYTCCVIFPQLHAAIQVWARELRMTEMIDLSSI